MKKLNNKKDELNLKLTEIISDTSGINNIYFTIDDLKLYNNITLGKHTVKVIYMKNMFQSCENLKVLKLQ